MNKKREKNWPNEPNFITESLAKNDKGSEEDFIALDEKDILERYLDSSDEPSPFFKGAALSFILCLSFWVIVIVIST